MSRITERVVIFADNATLSEAATGVVGLYLADAVLAGVRFPAAGWVAANITLQGAFGDRATNPEAGDFFDLFDAAGDEVVITEAAGFVPLDPLITAGVSWVRLRSGTSAETVQQTGGPLSVSVGVRSL